MEKGQPYLIKERTFDFALSLIKLYQKLQSEREFILSKQLLKSGTSIGANVAEAEAAQSRKDLVHKMSVANKEAFETRYWLNLIEHSQLLRIPLKPYQDEMETIIKILTKIVKTSKQNQ